MEHGETFLTGRERCPKCAAEGRDNSCDNLARYNDGHGYCYSCKHYEPGEGEVRLTVTPKEWKPLFGVARGIPERRIDENTCRKYGYQVLEHPEKGDIHINSFYKNGELIAQKYRRVDTKEFSWRGNAREAGLFGQELFDGGRSITITEGEIDAMSVYQANGGFPVVSLNGGTGNVEKNIKDNLEWICRFNEIVLMFDSDEAGREASAAAAAILPPGRVKIATLPYKDANECLAQNDSKAIVQAYFNAKLYSPDEIIHVKDVEREQSLDDQKIWDYPWDDLTIGLTGQRSGEIAMWVSGTGSGKSTVMREMAIHHLEAGRKVGMIMLEEAPDETKDDMISLMINAPVREIRAMRKLNELRRSTGKKEFTIHKNFYEEDYTAAAETLEAMGLYLYDHRGNNAYANALARMEYMAVSLDVDIIVLDHITALAAGLLHSEKSLDERQMMDVVMKDLRSLVARTGVHLDLVSQLKKTPGKSYEEGAPISVEDLRGSGSLGSVPNVIVAMERNRQDNNNFYSNCTALRCLKNRMTGRCGIMSAVHYDSISGRLEEVDWQAVEEEQGTRIIFKKKENKS